MEVLAGTDVLWFQIRETGGHAWVRLSATDLHHRGNVGERSGVDVLHCCVSADEPQQRLVNCGREKGRGTHTPHSVSNCCVDIVRGGGSALTCHTESRDDLCRGVAVDREADELRREVPVLALWPRVGASFGGRNESQTNRPVRGAVPTMPAVFDHKLRRRTMYGMVIGRLGALTAMTSPSSLTSMSV